MSRLLLMCRLAFRDLRRRPGPAALVLLAITAATTTLTLGLALNGVTSHPYQQTRAATNGADVVAQFPGPGGRTQALEPDPIQAAVKSLTGAPEVTRYSGPYPVASALLRTRGLTVPVEAQGRGRTPASVDQPKLTAGRWVSPGGVVLERTFALALGVGVGDRVALDGRSFLVTGIAVTAASGPYPNLCYTNCMFTMPAAPGEHLSSLSEGMAWITEAAARALASPAAPLTYVVNLKLKDPAAAPAFVARYLEGHQGVNAPNLTSWQTIASAAGLLVADEQSVLEPGAFIAGILAVASVAVLAGGRMAERTRRVGLLKAVGGTPELVTVMLLAENLVLALLAAAAGLAIGWLAAPLITSPGAGLIGTAGPPSLTLSTVGLVIAVALVTALASTFVSAVRSARTSTVSALSDGARPPRRRAWLITLSARLPAPLLLGVRMLARRTRRAALGAASIAVTTTGIVAVLAFRATVDQRISGASASRLGDPVVARDSQVVLVVTVVVVALAVLNAIFAAWATVLDSRRSAALARALGASPQQISAGVAAAQVLPALPGALVGVPLGLGLFQLANHGGMAVSPPAWWLAVAVLATWVAVAVLASVPARIGARRPVAEVLALETA